MPFWNKTTPEGPAKFVRRITLLLLFRLSIIFTRISAYPPIPPHTARGVRTLAIQKVGITNDSLHLHVGIANDLCPALGFAVDLLFEFSR